MLILSGARKASKMINTDRQALLSVAFVLFCWAETARKRRVKISALLGHALHVGAAVGYSMDHDRSVFYLT